MVQNTPAFGIPYVEDADFPKTYPAVSRDLAETIDGNLGPIRAVDIWNATGSGSGIGTVASAAYVHRPALCILSISWTHGSTSCPAGDQAFVCGTITDTRFRPLRITVGSLRKNAGVGICQISTGGEISIKWLSSTLASGHSVYVSFAYEIAAIAPSTEAAPPYLLTVPA